MSDIRRMLDDLLDGQSYRQDYYDGIVAEFAEKDRQIQASEILLQEMDRQKQEQFQRADNAEIRADKAESSLKTAQEELATVRQQLADQSMVTVTAEADNQRYVTILKQQNTKLAAALTLATDWIERLGNVPVMRTEAAKILAAITEAQKEK